MSIGMSHVGEQFAVLYSKPCPTAPAIGMSRRCVDLSVLDDEPGLEAHPLGEPDIGEHLVVLYPEPRPATNPDRVSVIRI